MTIPAFVRNGDGEKLNGESPIKGLSVI